MKKKNINYLYIGIVIIIFLIVIITITLNNKEGYCYDDVIPNNKISANEPMNLSTSSSICKIFKDISSYYGKTDNYMIDTESQYYKDVQTVTDEAKNKIIDRLNSNKLENCTSLIMSDLDDTIWNTFYELKNSNFCFDTNIFNIYAEKKKLPAIFPALELLRFCALNGIIPVFVTGRIATELQNNITLTQLQDISLIAGRDFWGG